MSLGNLIPKDFEEEVENKLFDIRAREEAQRRHRAGSFMPPMTTALSIVELSALPKVITPWRIEGLHRRGSNTTIIAVRKAGKSTLKVNIMKSLLDGVPFLGEHQVTQLDGTFAWCDWEQGQDLGREMLEAANIRNGTRALHWDLKGQRFNIMNDSFAEWFVRELKRLEVEAFAFDTFRKAFKGKSAIDDTEVAAFQDRIDQIKAESGVLEFFMAVHAGWDADKNDEDDIRTRGSSGLEDWPDALWTLGKKGKTRFFKAKNVRGMDDNALADERALIYDHATRELTYDGAKAGVTRATSKAHDLEEEIYKEILLQPGVTANGLGFKGAAAQERKAARDRLKLKGLIDVTTGGKNNAQQHWPKGHAPTGSIFI